MTVLWRRSGRTGDADADAASLPLYRFVHREMVLLTVLSIVAALAFAGTKLTARHVHALRERDAAAWHAIGLRELEHGRAATAAAALRRATTLAPGQTGYQLALARALAADHHPAQARQVLLRLREQQSEDPDVDLGLARLEANGGDAATAIRYYQHALAALWSDTQNERRPRVRLELVELLLRHGQRSRALSELLVLAPTMPDDAPARSHLGRLFLQVGDAERAAEQFATALRHDPAHPAALAGAAEAAFEQGQYGRARQLLARAPDAIARVRELRTLIEFVLSRDPLASRLRPGARRDRLLANAEHVAARLAGCDDAAAHAAVRREIDALLTSLRRRRAIGRDAAEDGIQVLSGAVSAIGDSCGPSGALDRALVLIARRHEVHAP